MLSAQQSFVFLNQIYIKWLKPCEFPIDQVLTDVLQCFCVFLKRFAYPCSYGDLVSSSEGQYLNFALCEMQH